jgi:hypothetical protein
VVIRDVNRPLVVNFIDGKGELPLVLSFAVVNSSAIPINLKTLNPIAYCL